MTNFVREAVKQATGGAVASLSSQCRFDQALFILAHMRCGSTALSNILCSRADISGYGESHVRYDGRGAMGRLVVNQALRKAWKPRAPHLFDKILHNRHDSAAPSGFYQARAIFVARHPGPAIRSIRKLYADLGREEYGSDELAAQYYVARLSVMAQSWDRFEPTRRVGLTHSAMIGDPDAALARISAGLTLRPVLENRYESPSASRKGGGGDPTTSGKFTRIEPRRDDPARHSTDALDIKDSLRQEVEAAFCAFKEMVGE